MFIKTPSDVGRGFKSLVQFTRINENIGRIMWRAGFGTTIRVFTCGIGCIADYRAGNGDLIPKSVFGTCPDIIIVFFDSIFGNGHTMCVIR